MPARKTISRIYLLVTTTHEKQGPLVREDTSSELLETLVAVEHLLDLTRECMQTLDDLVAALSERDAVLRKLKGHHEERDVLRRVRLEEHA